MAGGYLLFLDDQTINILEDADTTEWKLKPLQLDNGNNNIKYVTVTTDGRYMWVANGKGTLYYCEDGEYEVFEEGADEYRVYKNKEEYKTEKGIYTEEDFVPLPKDKNNIVYVDWKIVIL
jgi:hypothetical protein